MIPEKISEHLDVPFVFSGFQYEFEDAKVIVFGVPLDVTTCFKPGTKYGPNAIREASLATEAYVIDKKADLSDKALTYDIGNVFVTPGNIPKTLERVTAVTQEILNQGKIPLMLGGEHTVTLGALKAFKDSKPLVIQFDAHSDLREEWAGDKIAHMTVSRRILDFLPKQDLLQIGIRSMCKEEHEFIEKENISTIFRHEIRKDIESVKKQISEKSKGRNVYITLDIDVLDASLVPGTGTPEPDGLSYNELIELVKAINGKVVGLDMVEVGRDAELITPFTASKLLYEILSQEFFLQE